MQRRGNIIASNQTGVWAEFDNPNCSSCRSGCTSHHRQSRHRIFVSAASISQSVNRSSPRNQGQVLLSMPDAQLGNLMLRVYILPLIGFVIGALMAELLTLADIYVFLSAMVGMSVAIGSVRFMQHENREFKAILIQPTRIGMVR